MVIWEGNEVGKHTLRDLLCLMPDRPEVESTLHACLDALEVGWVACLVVWEARPGCGKGRAERGDGTRGIVSGQTYGTGWMEPPRRAKPRDTEMVLRGFGGIEGLDKS